jgi:hypothetical protein
MAGDWIKLQKDTPDKPEVLAIASRLNLDPDAVVGKLVRIWCWFDTHTVNGNASCVTFSFLDRITGVTGFAEQVALIGWLVQDGHNLRLPNFEYHNGETAKQRALGKNRAEKARSNAKSNAPIVIKSLPEKRREEKRRESNNKSVRDTRFEDFWSAWPKSDRKQDKAKCHDKWIDSNLDALLVIILADIEAKKLTRKWQDEDGKFIEAPLVYLNNKRWEDGSGSQSAPSAWAGAI